MGGIDLAATEISELIEVIGLNDSFEDALFPGCFGPVRKEGLYKLNYARGEETEIELAVSNNLPLLGPGPGGPAGKGGLPDLGWRTGYTLYSYSYSYSSSSSSSSLDANNASVSQLLTIETLSSSFLLW